MKSKLTIYVLSVAMLAILFGCKPDKLEVELYTSDIQQASSKGIVEVPLTATFKLMGDDDDGDLPKASNVAKKYLDKKAEFKMSKGDFGDVMVVKCTVPMGSPAALKTYLASNPRPYALTVAGSKVTLGGTQHLKSLNRDLSGINMMLGLSMPASNTVVRFVGDMAKAPEVAAIAVFVDKKAELVYRKKVERRKSIELEYKGGDESVYSEIEPQFKINF